MKKSKCGENQQWFVYVLKDPRTDSVRYVGWTVDIERRLYIHIWRAENDQDNNTHKGRWIRLLLKEGLKPIIETIESGYGDGWKESERRWVKHFRDAGCKLMNLTDGGEGTLGIVVKESTRRIQSALRKGRRDWWGRGIEAAIESNRGRKQTTEHIEKVRIANIGRRYSAEIRARMSEAAKKRKMSPEGKALLSAARRRKPLKHSEEFKRALVARNTLWWTQARASLKPGERLTWGAKVVKGEK